MLYPSPEARFDYLLRLPESADIGAKVNAAERDIEEHNPTLASVLLKTPVDLRQRQASRPPA